MWSQLNFFIVITGKNMRKWGNFSDSYFPVYGQNSIRISPYKDRIVDRKIRIRKSPYFSIYLRSEYLNVKQTFFASCFKIKLTKLVKVIKGNRLSVKNLLTIFYPRNTLTKLKVRKTFRLSPGLMHCQVRSGVLMRGENTKTILKSVR